LVTTATAEVTSRKNIFGGEDCTGDGVRSSSRPNIFGGYDVTYGDGTRTTSRANIFGGLDTTAPNYVVALEGTAIAPLERNPIAHASRAHRHGVGLVVTIVSSC